jgi:hypothetical protein
MTDAQIRIDKVDNDLKFYHWSKYVLASLVVLLVVLVSIVTVETLLSVQSTADHINSCIDPHGSCYKNGDRRSSSAIQLINDNQKKIVSVAAYCAKQPGNTTLQQIEDCVNKELKR